MQTWRPLRRWSVASSIIPSPDFVFSWFVVRPSGLLGGHKSKFIDDRGDYGVKDYCSFEWRQRSNDA